MSRSMQQLSARLQEEVEERASVRAKYTLRLLLRFRCWRCRWLAARKSLVRSSQSIKRRAWAKRASCPSWGGGDRQDAPGRGVPPLG